MDEPTPPSAGAWNRFRRFMVAMVVLAIAAIVAALAVLHSEGVTLTATFIVALAAGIGVSVLLAGALMGLVFASDRGGYDEGYRAPNEKGRPGGRP